jgi:CSLREA domain-containing protein
MRIKKLLAAFVFGLGFALALAWLLGGDRLPVACAASWTVTKKADSNDGVCDTDCSLREAIIAANGSGGVDTITLGLGKFSLSIIGTGENAAATGDLDITDDLIIEGLGPDQTFIDASGVISDRVFDIRSGASTVVISGVTIMDGHITGLGGGIYNTSADLTLVNVTVMNNVVTGTGSSGGGGGVYVNQGSLSLDGVQIVGNTANTDGGGVYVYHGTVSLDGVQIVSNTANSRGGGVYLRYGSGTLSSGAILSNTAGSSSGGGVVAYYAQAAFTQTGDSMVAYNAAAWAGGGVYAYQGSVTLLGGQIYSNTADMYGGGVCVYQAGAELTMSGGQVISNTAEERGGGIYIYFDSSATMSGGEVAHNTSHHYGGGVHVSEGVFTQTGGLLAHNTATTSGGGVYVGSGTAVLDGGQVIANTANMGGGLYNNNGTLFLVNTTVSGNRAESGSGGGLYDLNGTTVLTYTTVVSNAASTSGGGIFDVGGGNVTLQNSIVAYNEPANCGGTIVSNGHNLDSGTSCGLGATGDITDADPLLGSLAEENGAWVHPLLEDSPAIDKGLCLPGVTTVDQRGATRPMGNACDIGAYEFDDYRVHLPLVLSAY